MTPADWLSRAIGHYDTLAKDAAAPHNNHCVHAADLGILAAEIASVPAEVHAELEAAQRAADKHARFMADLLRDKGIEPADDDPFDDDRDGWPIGSVQG